MEPQQQLIEQMPFFWGIAFTINLTVGIVLFVTVMKQAMPSWATGVSTWVAWWAFATCISLAINVISGADAPFSYHQMGILTETMLNLGILMWTIIYTQQSWGIRGADWDRVEALRHQITLEKAAKNEDK